MFSEKKLKVEIDYLNKDFTLGKTLVFENLPVHIKATMVGLPSGNKAVIKIFGVSEEHANQITLLKYKQAIIPPRRVRLFADTGDGYKLFFEGYIISACPVYDNVPNIYVQIESTVGAFPNAKDISSNVFDPKTPAFQVFRKICSDYGYDCIEDFSGTTTKTFDKSMAYNQEGLFARLSQAQNDYDVDCFFRNGKFVVRPNKLDKFRTHYFTPKNYIGYPSFTETGISLKTDSIIDIGLHNLINVSGSEIMYANADWEVWKIDYELQSLTPNGHWYMILSGVARV